jgi:hypothetical protein
MATREKKIYALNATPELVKLTTITRTYKILEDTITLEEDEVAAGMPSEVTVEVGELLLDSQISHLWMDSADVVDFTAFVQHVKSLIPADTNVLHYEPTDTFESIKVENNNVTYLSGQDTVFVEELDMWTSYDWKVAHSANNENGEFFCDDFESVVNDILANGRATEKVLTLDDELKEKRKVVARHYQLLPQEDTTPQIQDRIVELMSFADPVTLTAEEEALLA